MVGGHTSISLHLLCNFLAKAATYHHHPHNLFSLHKEFIAQSKVQGVHQAVILIVARLEEVAIREEDLGGVIHLSPVAPVEEASGEEFLLFHFIFVLGAPLCITNEEEVVLIGPRDTNVNFH